MEIAVDGINDSSGSSVADTANETDADVAGTAVFVDEPTTLDETFTTGDPANYTSTLTCLYGPDDTPITVAADGSFTTPAAAKDTTIRCEFTNTRNSATLTLEKEWVDGEAGDSARLIINGANGATATTTGGNQVSTEKATATVYAGDTVGLAESLTTPSGASYQSSLACDGQTITAIGTSGTYTVPADPDAVTCRFNNTKRGSITIVKDVTNTANGLSPNVFDFGGDLGTFELADNGVADANTSTFGNLVAGEYTVTETDANANGFSLDSINCGNASVAPVTDGVTITLGVAGSVTCTFVNEAEGDLSITKTAKANQPVSLGGDSFSVTYDVVVTNNGPGATTYDLSDTPDFGTGADVTAIEVTLPGGSTLVPALPAAGGDIVTSDAIAGGASETVHGRGHVRRRSDDDEDRSHLCCRYRWSGHVQLGHGHLRWWGRFGQRLCDHP